MHLQITIDVGVKAFAVFPLVLVFFALEQAALLVLFILEERLHENIRSIAGLHRR